MVCNIIGCSDGIPIISLPKYGMGSSGMHSDCSSYISLFLCNNFCLIFYYFYNYSCQYRF